ncbi:MAG: hydrogenase subunit MbhD domain-containing protein [Deefgea sp.]
MGLIFDGSLFVLILILATWIIAVRDTFSAAIGFAIYGLLLALVWVRLDAIDAALTEAAIGGGLSGILLIGAAMRLRPTEAKMRAESPNLAIRLIAALLSILVTAGLVYVVLALPETGPTLVPQVANNMASTGLGNPVTAVLLAFRSTDTLLEAIVLVLALIAVWSLTPDQYWGGRPGKVTQNDPNSMLTYLARLLPPIGIVVAVYILWVGADLPGGKFQAGTLLAAMALLLVMAGLMDLPAISNRALRLSLVLGTVVFLAIGFAGIPLAGAFLAYPDGFAKPLIIAIEFASMISIAVTLALLVIGIPKRSESK